MRIGFDTGFFVELLKGNSEAATVWEEVVEGKHEAFVSCLTLYELYRLALKGKLDKSSIDEVLSAIEESTTVIWLTHLDMCRRAASLSHGTGIPTIDAIILSGLLEKSVDIIYTTDSHFARYSSGALKVKVL